MSLRGFVGFFFLVAAVCLIMGGSWPSIYLAVATEFVWAVSGAKAADDSAASSSRLDYCIGIGDSALLTCDVVNDIDIRLNA